MWLTVGKWCAYLTGQLEKWMTEMSGDVLTVYIEAFRLMELSQSGVNTGIPGPPFNIGGERDGRESQPNCIIDAKTFET
jgi:hypothetical protein